MSLQRTRATISLLTASEALLSLRHSVLVDGPRSLTRLFDALCTRWEMVQISVTTCIDFIKVIEEAMFGFGATYRGMDIWS
jgi:hypothetical protein